MDRWQGKRVLVLGAARQGIAMARWLIQHGAAVTVSDLRAESALPEATSALRDLPVRWALGGHPLELLDTTDVLGLANNRSRPVRKAVPNTTE